VDGVGVKWIVGRFSLVDLTVRSVCSSLDVCWNGWRSLLHRFAADFAG